MTPEHQAAVRGGCNLATLPASVRAELQQDLERCRGQHQTVRRRAAELFSMRGNRLKVERELGRLGELEKPVRAALNQLISGSRK